MEGSQVRLLGPGDEAFLAALAERDAEFDLAGRGGSLVALSREAAGAYLSNPDVLHWVALSGEELLGFLYCIMLPMRAGDERELLLYEIGVHQDWRRQGIGRRLIAEMESWMRENGVPEVWLGADNSGAEAFYRACGFAPDATPSVFMSKRLG